MKKLIFILLCFVLSLCTAAERPVIIINSEAQVEKLSYRNLLRIYSMQQKRWPNGKKIKVFTLPLSDTTHQNFVKKILRSQPYQLERHWKRLLFSGIGKTPTTVDSEQKMLNMVEQTSGAIGYLRADAVVEPSLILEVK